MYLPRKISPGHTAIDQTKYCYGYPLANYSSTQDKYIRRTVDQWQNRSSPVFSGTASETRSCATNAIAIKILGHMQRGEMYIHKDLQARSWNNGSTLERREIRLVKIYIFLSGPQKGEDIDLAPL